MKKLTDEQVACLVEFSASKHCQTVLGLLKDWEGQLVEQIRFTNETEQLLRIQGAMRLLNELIQPIEHPQEILKKRKGA